MSERLIKADDVKAALLGWDTDPTDEEIEAAIDGCPTAVNSPAASESLAKYCAGGGSLARDARSLERVLRMKLEDSGPFDEEEAAALKELVDLMKDYRFLGVCPEQELLEENRRLQGIVDGFASKVEEQMVRIARECNGAGGSEAADRAVELSLLQAELAAMDRECVVHAEPVDGVWRIDWIRVGDREIYRREDGPDGED